MTYTVKKDKERAIRLLKRRIATQEKAGNQAGAKLIKIRLEHMVKVHG